MTTALFAEVAAEMARAESLHGTGHEWPNGTGPTFIPWLGRNAALEASHARAMCDFATSECELHWSDVACEEVAEALAEDDPARLRAECVQVMAVFGRWIAAQDARAGA